MNHSQQRRSKQRRSEQRRSGPQERKPGRQQMRLTLSLLLIVVLLMTGTTSGAAQGPSSSAPDATDSNPKLEWSLNQLLFAYERAGMAGAQAFSDTGAVEVDDGRVTVTIHASLVAMEDLEASIPELGGEVRNRYGQRLVARVPISALEPLAGLDVVEVITEPRQPTLLEPELVGRYTSEGVAASNAANWHAAGNRGAGVRVAIIDAGFSGYASLLGSDLPNNVTTYDWTGTGTGGSSHGTACAEIAYDMAPQATLYLHKVNYATDLGQAVDQAIADGVDVISMSLGWTIDGPGDGTGFLAGIVKKARQNGILFATAAGNEADETWHSIYQDDGAGHHQWPLGEAINELTATVNAGQAIRLGLHWDDWSGTGQDYDLELFRWTGASWSLVAASRNRQSSGYATPEEWIGIYAPQTGTYGLAVSRYSASRDACFRVLAPKMGALDHFSAGQSLTFPADSSDAVSAAALDAALPYPLESYSSRGPTFGPGGTCNGGATKPDVAGYANVSTISYGPTYFNGTSAAAPHVAGAAALIKGAYPAYSPAQVQTFLEQRAMDQGPPDKDNAYGAGRLHLGTPPGGNNTAPVISGLPDQILAIGTSSLQAIDLWAYSRDTESTHTELAFGLDNVPDPRAGVTIRNSRYVAIEPQAGWTGQTEVVVGVTDPGGLSDADTFQVTISEHLKTWTGASSADWHTAGNWMPGGTPTAEDEVTILKTARAPVVSTANAVAKRLTLEAGAVLDLGSRELTVEGELANYGTLKQTRPVDGKGVTPFLRIRNQAGTQTRYYGVDLAIDPGAFTPDAGTAAGRSAATASESESNPPSLLMAADSSQAGPLPTSAPGQLVLTAVADAGLLQGYPAANYGDVWIIPGLERPTGMMWAGYDTHLDPPGKTARGLLRFDLAELPDEAEISQATLRLYLLVSYGQEESDLLVTAYRATADWSEEAVSWKNSPGYAGADGVEAIPHAAWGWYEVDVTATVQAWYEGSSNHGFYLRGQESELGWRGFATREETLPPQLVIQYTGGANTAPVLANLPDQSLPKDGSLARAIDLWQYASDAEDSTNDLAFSVDNAPNPAAGVELESNRYISIEPNSGWTGTTRAKVRVEDTGGLSDGAGFQVTVSESPLVTVAVSGNQHCDGRISGVNRCYDIEPSAPLETTVRYYFTEGERLGLVLDELRVYHEANGWQQVPGTTLTGSEDLARGLFVQAEGVAQFSAFALDTEDGAANRLLLPLVARHEPPAPDAPVLDAIDNDDSDGSYLVTWQPSEGAESYTLQEDDNIFFTSPTIRYAGPGTTWQATNMRDGFHYYRVQASGPTGDSDWSNRESVEVTKDPTDTKFFAIGDAGVYQGVADQNFGSNTDMWAGYGLGYCGTPVDYQISRSLLRFNLGSIPGGTPIEEASLYVKTYRLCYRPPTTPRAVTAYRATDAWAEGTVTWDNQPVAGEAYGSASVPFLDAGVWKAIDLTDLVRGWVDGSLPNEGLILRGPEKDDANLAWLGFYTRESENVPYLQVTFQDEATASAASAGEAIEAGKGGPLLVGPCQAGGGGEVLLSCSGD